MSHEDYTLSESDFTIRPVSNTPDSGLVKCHISDRDPAAHRPAGASDTPSGVLVAIPQAGDGSAGLPRPLTETDLSPTAKLADGNEATDARVTFLGNIRNIRPPLLEGQNDPLPAHVDTPDESRRWAARDRIYRLQAVSKSLLPDNVALQCCGTELGGEPRIVQYGDFAYLEGARKCGRLWVCPLCAAKITELRRAELEEGASRWVKAGGWLVMVTYTLRHDVTMPLETVLGGFRGAFTLFSQGMPYKRFLTRYSVSGAIRSLEVTHGGNGWHVHEHELLFLKSKPDVEALEFSALDRWLKALQKAKMSGNDHALKVIDPEKAEAEFVARYVAKFGHDPSEQTMQRRWGIEEELAKTPSKRSRAKEGYTPFGILEAVEQARLNAFDPACVGQADLWQTHSEEYASLFRQYAEQFHGKRQLRWSHGLRVKLGLADEEKDDITLANEDGSGSIIATLDPQQWRTIIANDARLELEQAATRTGIAGVYQLLEDLK